MKRCLSCAHNFEAALWQCPACSWQPAVIDDRPAFAAELAAQNSGFSSEYFCRLAEVESGHFWFESRNELIFWALGKYFAGMRSILEVGCGTGFVLAGMGKRFPHVRLAGSEVFREGLSFAASRMPDTELLQMDAREIPFTGEFDVIGAFDVIEHIDEDKDVLGQMYRAVNPGGGIIVTVPQHRWLWSAVDDYSYHKRRYTRSELTDKVNQAGFRVVRVTSFITLLLPVLIASRARYKRGQRFESDAEVRVNARLNRMLTAVLSLERGLIRAGVPMPGGGSLLLIARKEAL
jgi:SAM-dependent methyltransferase